MTYTPELDSIVLVARVPENRNAWPLWVSEMDEQLGHHFKVTRIGSKGNSVAVELNRTCRCCGKIFQGHWWFHLDWLDEVKKYNTPTIETRSTNALVDLDMMLYT